MKKPILSIKLATSSVALFCLIVLTHGCQDLDQRDALTPPRPAWQYSVDHFKGSVQSGPRPEQAIHVDPNTNARITVTWVGLTRNRRELLSPIQSRIHRIVTLPKSNPVRPVSQFVQNARFGSIDNAEAFLLILTDTESKPGRMLGESTCALPMAVCSEFSITSLDAPSTHTALQLGRPSPQTLQIALVTTARSPAESSQVNPPSPVTEMVILEPVATPNTAQFALLLPSPFSESPITTLAALIEIHGPGQFTMDATLLDQLNANLAKANPSEHTPTQVSLWQSLQEAVDKLYDPVLWRRNLLFLATETEAALAQEITLAGNWNMARQLATDISIAVYDEEPNDLPQLGWIIEHSAYALLLEETETEQSSPNIEAWLMLHTGQLGRDPTTLHELISVHHSAKELNKALIQENKLYLLDMSPAARSRAYEWLSTQGVTLEGYDPLASAKARREALKTLQEYYN